MPNFNKTAKKNYNQTFINVVYIINSLTCIYRTLVKSALSIINIFYHHVLILKGS